MPGHGSRRRTAHPPNRAATLAAWLVITVIAVWVGLFTASRPIIWVSALGESVTAEARTPSVNLCQPSIAVYVGIPNDLPQTEDCNPFKMQITIPTLINWGDLPATATSAPSSTPTPSQTKNDPPAHKRMAGHNLPLSPTQVTGRELSQAQTAVQQNLGTATSGIHNGLQLVIGLIFTLITMIVGAILLFALNHARHWRTGRVYSRRANIRILAAMLAVCVVLVGGSWVQSSNWANSKSLVQVVGSISKLVPAPAGPVNTLNQGAVIGDSTVAHEGGLLAHWPCYRGTDSLANLLTGHITDPIGPPGTVSDNYSTIQWKNVACAGATIEQGLLGPQSHPNPTGPSFTEPAQVGVLKQYRNLKWVIVEIGENDVGLGYDAKICVVQGTCFNAITADDFTLRLARFANDYNLLLEELADLPSQPHIIVNLPYDVMEPSASLESPVCPDARYLSAQDIQLLNQRNQQLRTKEYEIAHQDGITTVQPQLIPLCEPTPVGQPDLIGLWLKNGQPNPEALHPTLFGEEQIEAADAAAVNRMIEAQASTSSTANSPGQ